MRDPADEGPRPGVRDTGSSPRRFRSPPPSEGRPPTESTSDAGRPASNPSSASQPVDLARWVDGRREAIIRRWLEEIERRPGGPRGEVVGLYRSFCTLLVRAVSAALGPYREQIDGSLQQAAELYGSLGAFRGLAAGEVVEEVQILREVILRFLYADPPIGGEGLLSLRDVLRLNRALDRAVTQASVGHTDALFFQLFRGSGVPERVPGEQLEEVREQLASIRAEFDEVVEAADRG